MLKNRCCFVSIELSCRNLGPLCKRKSGVPPLWAFCGHRSGIVVTYGGFLGNGHEQAVNIIYAISHPQEWGSGGRWFRSSRPDCEFTKVLLQQGLFCYTSFQDSSFKAPLAGATLIGRDQLERDQERLLFLSKI